MAAARIGGLDDEQERVSDVGGLSLGVPAPNIPSFIAMANDPLVARNRSARRRVSWQQSGDERTRLNDALAAQVDPEQTVEDGWVRRCGEHLETSNNRVLARRM